MTFKNLFIDHKRTRAEEEWVREELADQEQRFAKIDKQMRELAPVRAKWYEEFFDRLCLRGFNADGDQKVKIKPEDLPAKPEGREDRVIWKHGVDTD